MIYITRLLEEIRKLARRLENKPAKTSGSFKVKISIDKRSIITATINESSCRVTIYADRQVFTLERERSSESVVAYLMKCELSKECTNETLKRIGSQTVSIPTDYSLQVGDDRHLERAVGLYIDYLKNEAVKD